MPQDAEKEGDFLFNENVDKYDSFLRKSTYLDSPRQNTPDDLNRRKTAGFGQSINSRIYQPDVYEDSVDESEEADGVDLSEEEEGAFDFTISFMRSQTEYFHRFIRFKNVDPDRQVILENAVERYLVTLEQESDPANSKNRNKRSLMGNRQA